MALVLVRGFLDGIRHAPMGVSVGVFSPPPPARCKSSPWQILDTDRGREAGGMELARGREGVGGHTVGGHVVEGVPEGV